MGRQRSKTDKKGGALGAVTATIPGASVVQSCARGQAPVAGFPSRQCGIDRRSCYVRCVVDKVGIREGSRQVLRFPLPVLIPPNAAYSHLKFELVWYYGPLNGLKFQMTL
jgi:hypothetical protein